MTNEQYAAEIAEKWNVPSSVAGYVTRLEVKKTFVDKYEMHTVGGANHTEWWIPANDLEALNDNIVGKIEVIAEFGSEDV